MIPWPHVDGACPVPRPMRWVAIWSALRACSAAPYVIDGRVTHGEGRPPARLCDREPPTCDQAAAAGVFAVEVTGLDGDRLPGASNRRHPPTANAARGRSSRCISVRFRPPTSTGPT